MLRAGIGNGARVAAVVSQLCRGVKAGVALISYPVDEAMPMHIGLKRSADESNDAGDNSVRPASPVLHAAYLCTPPRHGDGRQKLLPAPCCLLVGADACILPVHVASLAGAPAISTS